MTDEAPISADDIKTPEQLRELFNRVNNNQLEWLQKVMEGKIALYAQGFQTELSMHRTDLMAFTINVLLRLLGEQEARIEELERLARGPHPADIGG